MFFTIPLLTGTLLMVSTVMAMDDSYEFDLTKTYQHLHIEFPSLTEEQFWQLYELHGNDEKRIAQTIKLTQQSLGFEHLSDPSYPPVINRLYKEIENDSRQFFFKDPLAIILASQKGEIKPYNAFLLNQFEVKLADQEARLLPMIARFNQFEEAIPKMKKGLDEMIAWFSDVKEDKPGNFIDSSGVKYDLRTYEERRSMLVAAQEQFKEFNIEFSELELSINIRMKEKLAILDHIAFLRERVKKDKMKTK
jgi:hypothetical protein